MRGLRTAVAALVVAGTVTGGGYALAATDGGTPGEVVGPGSATVEVTVRDSRFVPDRIRAWEGTRLHLVVRNEDPIAHEMVVGPESVHLRHAEGTEAAHPPVPGEVSLGPGQTGATVVDLDRPGTLRSVCHLPRHEDFGMVGEVEVLARPT